MDIRLLGPVEVDVEGRPVPLGAAKQRALLAVLALHANRAVAAEDLIEALWGEPPPATAPKMVQQYVSQLRKLLRNGGAAEIVTRGRAYELRVAPAVVDVRRFEGLVADGAEREGLALWRGPPLADIADEPFAAAAIRRLEEQRLSALERAIEAELAAGGHRELVGELEALVAQHPFSERLHGQLMLALYRSGRQAEALETYRRARHTLVEQLGIEPGPPLRALHEAILRQDVDLPPELDVSSPLVGRAAELERLRAAWAHGGIVVLTGPAGSGRTRLAAELAAEVQREGALVLYGTDAIDRPRDARRPALLVVEELDRANLKGPGPFRLVVVTGGGLVPGATRIALGPLDVASVAMIAALYAPADAVIPAEQLAAQSGGLPRPAHRVAAEWARAEGTRRLTPVADRIETGRGGLRRAERELAGRVTELQAVRERAERHARTVVVCPFKGLATYDVADAEFFFGRERLVSAMVARLAGASLLAVVGPSGSGKSSALRAGLLAELQRGVLPGSENWTQALIRPGELPDTDLIAVDQFEEVFTRYRDEAERAAFIDAIVRSDRRIVLAIRADFYGRCAQYPELAALLGLNHVLVGPMQRDELRRVIEQPGLHVEAALTDRLLADTEREPGALPLLSTALLELWERRDGRTLRLAAYEHTGGVRGAVARLAEDAYGRLDGEQQAAARRILLRLAGEDDVRRRVALEELDEDRAVLDTLAARRLVTLSDGQAEVAHEALLREWPRLREWLEQDAEGRRIHQRLADAAREWDAGGRDSGELYRGARLAAALEHATDLNAPERAFLTASRARAERELRRLRALLAAVATLAVLALAAGALSLDQRGDARAKERAAEAQRLGAQALVEDDLDRSLLLARQGVAIEDSLPTRNNLLAALLRSPAAIHAVRLSTLGLSNVALTPDGRVLLAGDDEGIVHFLDPATGRPSRRPYRSEAGYVRQIVFNRDGSRLAIGHVGRIDLFDGRTFTRVHALAVPDGDIQFINVAFSPNGRALIAMYETPETSVLLRFDGRTGASLGPPITTFAGSEADAVGYGPGGRWIVTLARGDDGAVLIRDPRTLAQRRRYTVGYVSGGGALAPDGRTFAFGANDGLVRFLDLRSGALRTAFGHHDSAVRAMQFTADGRTLVSAANDGTAIIWDVRSATAVETLSGHAGAISSLAVDRRARTLYTASGDGTVIMWDLAGDRRVGRPFLAGTTSGAREISITASSDGRTVAVRQADGSVSLVDVATLARHRVPAGGGETPFAPAFGADGTLVAGGENGYLALVDARSGRVRARLLGHHGVVLSPATTADGTTIASTGGDGTLRLWDTRTARALGAPIALGGEPATGPALSPDGRTVAVGLYAGILHVFDVRSHRPLAQLRVDASWPSAVRFSRDGRLLLVGTEDGNVRVYSAQSLRPSGPAFAAIANTITSVDASPDDATLVATGLDGSVRLWDLASRRAIGKALPGPDLAAVATFTRDGQYVVAVFADGRGYRWDVRPSAWSRQACAVAGRRLTRAEWADALPERPYSPAC